MYEQTRIEADRPAVMFLDRPMLIGLVGWIDDMKLRTALEVGWIGTQTLVQAQGRSLRRLGEIASLGETEFVRKIMQK